MDFYTISANEVKGVPQLYPDWTVGRSKDLMVRGKSFYAVWDEARGLWSTDEYDVQRLVDEDLHNHAKKSGLDYKVMNLKSFNTNVWTSFRRYMANISDNSHPLDETLTFANDEVKKTDYVSHRLPYPLEEGSTDAWDELVGVLYSEEERAKIEWAIGAIVAGDAKRIQKFLVFYGPAGSGKSTILNVIHKLFEGYVTTFDARALGSSNSSFSTEVFKSNPLVAIQHDGDLSRIDDNTKLNSIISHEEITMNEKFKPSYNARVNAFLFMGTNQPVRISDAKSGIIRRLIDVHPTGVKIEHERYHILMDQIDFELGALAYKCLEQYRAMGRNYYSAYRPLEMMLQTDIFYNFVESVYDIFKAQDGVTLKQAYALYKEFCADTGIDKVLPQYKFREELRNYFDKFEDRAEIEGVRVRSYYSGFKDLMPPSQYIPASSYLIDLNANESVFDRVYSELPAQYGNPEPVRRWENVKTTLGSLDTKQLHWVMVPEEHIVLDFDLVDEDGEKDLELNILEASKLPPTYAELSSSGKGLHLHYIYHGDVNELSSVYSPGIEIKTLLGNSALRRKLTQCNSIEIATISGGLPKKEKRMIDNQNIKSEKGLRDLIDRNLRKEIHPGTKPSVDFIHKILDDAYESGMSYDVRDMRATILTFAARSTHHSQQCIKLVQKMQFVGQQAMPEVDEEKLTDPLVFYDVEVYMNLFVVCWKYQGSPTVVRMINPTAQEIEPLFKLRLIGFNNRRYDNHILYGCFMGYSLEELYLLNQKLISGTESAFFGEAFNISYADIYDFSSKKQGLKKFQIELGIHHEELDLPYDKPVPEEMWDKVVEYCVNDVISEEVVFEDRKQDFVARQILAELSGLSVNHTTQNHTARIIFGEEKNPQKQFVYTDLSKEFKGYKFDGRESTYRGETPGEGGYVYAEPGMYSNVTVLDIASMHPTSIERLNLFGPYTSRYSELKEARMAIKHKEYVRAANLLEGKLGKFLDESEGSAENLAYALKIVINIVYGLTSARFNNAFRDIRNVDNIVAKRGALFMIDLKHLVQKQGFTVAHIKTDSIKIPDATPELIEAIVKYGKDWGYDFEYEGTYDKFCLVNDAVYIARTGDRWMAVGPQFQHPYVFKTLFTHELLEFDDLCETKHVTQGTMYLDFNDSELVSDMVHVGRTGSFVPVEEGGGNLWRVKMDSETGELRKYHVTGTKGYRWIERETAAARNRGHGLRVDMVYFDNLKNAAFNAIDYFGPFEHFVT